VRVEEPGEGWMELKKGGLNGFYIIVVSLGWWYKAIEGNAGKKEFSKMLKDVLWVCEHMNERGDSGLKQGQRKSKGKGREKRGGKDEGNQGRKKYDLTPITEKL
jgi:hypothetical protein